MKLAIDQDLAQTILNYLATRPYSEVYILIAQLQQLVPPTEETSEEPAEGPAQDEPRVEAAA